MSKMFVLRTRIITPSICIFSVNPSLRPYNTICIQNMLFHCVLYHDNNIQNDVVGDYTQPNLT